MLCYYALIFILIIVYDTKRGKCAAVFKYLSKIPCSYKTCEQRRQVMSVWGSGRAWDAEMLLLGDVIAYVHTTSAFDTIPLASALWRLSHNPRASANKPTDA